MNQESQTITPENQELDAQLKGYRQLDIAQIKTTIERLERRISERFPGASLALVAKTLNQMAERTEQTTTWIATPILSLRLFICFLIALIIFGIISAFHVFDWRNRFWAFNRPTDRLTFGNGLECRLYPLRN